MQWRGASLAELPDEMPTQKTPRKKHTKAASSTEAAPVGEQSATRARRSKKKTKSGKRALGNTQRRPRIGDDLSRVAKALFLLTTRVATRMIGANIAKTRTAPEISPPSRRKAP